MKKGVLGGWVESLENVRGNGVVRDNGIVGGNGVVRDNGVVGK